MELTLTTWERISLVDVVGQVRGNLATLRKAGKALDVLELTDEEEEEIELVRTLGPEGSVIQWNDKGDQRTWEVEIGDKEAAAIVKRAFVQHEGWRVGERERVEALAEKLGV